MSANDQVGSSQKPEARISGKAVIIMMIFVICLMGFLDILSWLVSHGGLFSTIGAYGEVQKRASSIEVDSSGLRLPIATALGLLSIIVCAKIKEFNFSSRMAGLIFGAIVIGGGFILDGIFDHQFVSQYMAAHGYSRCLSGDFAVGNGKSRVWFENYIAPNEACVARR